MMKTTKRALPRRNDAMPEAAGKTPSTQRIERSPGLARSVGKDYGGTMSDQWIDLTTERQRFLISGTDRVRYLNGQITNDVRKCTPSRALAGCLCNAKGRIEAEMVVTRDASDHALLVDGPVALGGDLLARLEKYLVSDDVEITDITHQSRLWHVPGPLPVGIPPPAAREARRLGIPGHDIWERDGDAAIAPGGAMAPAERQRLRLLHGVPAWGAELLPGEVFPAEAGMDTWAVDFHKGCYVGQEIVSRIQSAGKVNRRLCLLQGTGSPPAAGTSLCLPDGKEPLAAITSVAEDGTGWLALAFLPRVLAVPETRLVIAGESDSLIYDLEVRNFLPSGSPG